MSQNKSFQESVGRLFAFGQFFGMLPVINITSSDENQLKFQWRSLRTIYSCLFIVLASIEAFMATWRIITIGFTVAFAETMMFFIISVIRAILMLRLAIKWKAIMKYWRQREDVFLNLPYEQKGWSLKRKITVVFVIMTLALFGRKIYS